MHVYSNIQTFVGAPTLFELFLFRFYMCDGGRHLSYSRQRETQWYIPFLLILYQVMSLYGIHFSNFLNSIHGSLHLYSNFIQTLSHTKTQITKLICCIYATLSHSGYKNAITLNFFKSVVESFFLNRKYI